MNGDPLFWNKVVGSVLTAGLIAMVAGFISHFAYNPQMLETPAYAIGGNAPVQQASASAEPAGPEPVAGMLASADAAKGEAVFKKCKACHTTENGGANKVGPNLWNIVGQPKAGSDGYKYSGALKDLGGNWSFADLNHFLYKPKDFAKGTKMTFAGLKKPADRANVIRYLHSLSDSPVPLP